MKLKPDLRDAFMAAAETLHRPASQLIRGTMRDFVETHTEPDEEYRGAARCRVEKSRKTIAERKVHSNEEVCPRMKARFQEWERTKCAGAA